VAGWAFGALLQDVLAHDELARVDAPVQRLFVAHREAWLTWVMRGASNLGNTAALAGLVVAAGLAWRWRARSWQPLGLLVAALAGAWGLSNITKQLTHRPRPPAAEAIGHWTGFTFPSGHATHATAVYGMLAWLAAATTPRWGRKVTGWTAAVVVCGLVGVSRLYLGAHWLTDVLGGLALGAAWLAGLPTLARTIPTLRTADRAAPPAQPAATLPPHHPPPGPGPGPGGDRLVTPLATPGHHGAANAERPPNA